MLGQYLEFYRKIHFSDAKTLLNDSIDTSYNSVVLKLTILLNVFPASTSAQCDVYFRS